MILTFFFFLIKLQSWEADPTARPEFLDLYSMLKDVKDQSSSFASKEDLIDKRTVANSQSIPPIQEIANTFGGKVNYNLDFDKKKFLFSEEKLYSID